MSSVIENHRFTPWILLSLFKENFKNILFNSLITARSFENLSYQVARCHKDGDFEEHAQTYHEPLN